MADQLKVPLFESEKAFKPTTVCVTGATGYIAGHIVQRLLAAGHTVHSTCRDPSKESSVGHLKKLPGADERLKLFKADLLHQGSFDKAIAGCEYVFHTASPYVANVPKGKERETVIDPAINGTLNVVGAVNKTKSVKRLIVTSSCAAVYGDPEERGKDHVFTEEDWSIAPTETELSYFFSKREAEKKAFEECDKQDRWSLVTMNPAMVMGTPLSTRSGSESVEFMKMLASGMMWPACPGLGVGFCDVRDVAAAHCLGMTVKEAKGRYILASSSHFLGDLLRSLKPRHPKLKYPLFNAPKIVLMLLGPFMGIPRDIVRTQIGKIPYFSFEKTKKDLGIEPIDPTDCLDDMLKGMAELGIVKLPA